MTEDERADWIMTHRLGFPKTEIGPNVTALRQSTRAMVGRGLVDRSPGTWAPECGPAGLALSHEERARALLEIDWAVERGHSCSINLVDSAPLQRRFDCRTMTSYWRWRPELLRPWLEDRASGVAMRYRIWRDWLLGRRNPYRSVRCAQCTASVLPCPMQQLDCPFLTSVLR